MFFFFFTVIACWQENEAIVRSSDNADTVAVGIVTQVTIFIRLMNDIYVYVFLNLSSEKTILIDFFFFFYSLLNTVTQCMYRWFTAMIRARSCRGPWTEHFHRRCASFTPSCQPTGSVWAPWKPCSIYGRTRRSSRASCWYQNP